MGGVVVKNESSLKRPILLTVVLIFILAMNLFTILVFFSISLVPAGYLKLLDILRPYAAPYSLYSIVELMGAIMVWKWMKAGLYLLFGSIIISPILATIVNPTQTSINYPQSLIFTTLLLGLLYFGAKPVWNKFK